MPHEKLTCIMFYSKNDTKNAFEVRKVRLSNFQ